MSAHCIDKMVSEISYFWVSFFDFVKDNGVWFPTGFYNATYR